MLITRLVKTATTKLRRNKADLDCCGNGGRRQTIRARRPNCRGSLGWREDGLERHGLEADDNDKARFSA
jgi:hypothetical protein